VVNTTAGVFLVKGFGRIGGGAGHYALTGSVVSAAAYCTLLKSTATTDAVQGNDFSDTGDYLYFSTTYKAF